MSVDLKAIIGNDELKNRISRDISDRTFSHAYIIEGPQGIGKHTLAYNIAAALACTSSASVPCGKCISCEKILAGKSPDVITVSLEPDRVTLGVDSVRTVREDIVVAPNDLDLKVYIVEDADVMTQQAQNAFLLSLEDPPPYVIFLLLCENASSLLETVRSRAPSLRMERLDDEIIEAYLLENKRSARQLKDEDEEAFRILIHAADGRIGNALKLLDGKRRKALLDGRRAAEDMISLFANQDRVRALGLISSLGNKRQDIIENLTQVSYAIRDLIVIKKADGARLCFYHDKDRALELSSSFTVSSLLLLHDTVSEALNDLEMNCNVRLTVMNMLQNAGLI